VQFGAVLGHPVLATHKVFVVAHENPADAELANQAVALPARGEAGCKCHLAVGALASRVSERAGLAVH